MKEAKRPNSRRNLDIAIDRLCASTGDEPGRVKRLLATAIVGQMRPDGAAKGGNALKIRFGKDATRFSRDLDTARASSLDDYIARLEDALAIGWSRIHGDRRSEGARLPERRSARVRHAPLRDQDRLQRQVVDDAPARGRPQRDR